MIKEVISLFDSVIYHSKPNEPSQGPPIIIITCSGHGGDFEGGYFAVEGGLPY